MTGPDSCAMTGSAPAATGADALLVAFARAVRAAGVAVTADRATLAATLTAVGLEVEAMNEIGNERRRGGEPIAPGT